MQNNTGNSAEFKADKTPFLKFYSGDWIAGTLNLSFEEKGFYLECLLRMWERKSGLPNDDRWLASALNCNPRTVRKLKASLIASGKLVIDGDCIINPRLMRDIGQRGSVRIRPELEPNSTRIGAEFEANEPKNPTITTHAPARVFHIPEARDQKEEIVAATASRGAAELPTDEDLEKNLIEACNGSLDNPVNCLGLLSLATPKMWIAQGCDLEADILPTLRAAGRKYHGKRIRDWGYFTGMVTDAKAKRERGLPEPSAAPQATQSYASERIEKARALRAKLKESAHAGQ